MKEVKSRKWTKDANKIRLERGWVALVPGSAGVLLTTQLMQGRAYLCNLDFYSSRKG